jgi:hypothetical protein
MIGMMSSSMNCHGVGAVFLLANSQYAADPANNSPRHAADDSAHETADRSKDLIPGAGTGTCTITGAWHDTLSLRSGCYCRDRDDTHDEFETCLHVCYPPLFPENVRPIVTANETKFRAKSSAGSAMIQPCSRQTAERGRRQRKWAIAREFRTA